MEGCVLCVGSTCLPIFITLVVGTTTTCHNIFI